MIGLSLLISLIVIGCIIVADAVMMNYQETHPKRRGVSWRRHETLKRAYAVLLADYRSRCLELQEMQRQ